MPLNVFGEALKANEYRWTEQLCMADSDGDGLTNGEERFAGMDEGTGEQEATGGHRL